MVSYIVLLKGNRKMKFIYFFILVFELLCFIMLGIQTFVLLSVMWRMIFMFEFTRLF
jgi:hypothetical protein